MQLILHFGAKVRDKRGAARAIADPDKQLTWLVSDRATVLFRDMKEIEARRAAFVALIREWIKHV